MKNMREIGEMGEEEGFCIFLIRDNVVVGDNDFLIFFLNDEGVVQDNDNCFKKNNSNEVVVEDRDICPAVSYMTQMH